MVGEDGKKATSSKPWHDFQLLCLSPPCAILSAMDAPPPPAPSPLAAYLAGLHGWPRPYALRTSQCAALAAKASRAALTDPALRPALLLLSWSLARIQRRYGPRLGALSHGHFYDARYDGPPLEATDAGRARSRWIDSAAPAAPASAD